MDLKPEGKVQIRTDFSLYAMNLACLVSAAHCRTRRALIHHESPLLSHSLQKLDVNTGTSLLSQKSSRLLDYVYGNSIDFLTHL